MPNILRRFAAAALAVAALAFAAPAAAQNYTLKDAAGTVRTFCSYIVVGVQYPCPVIQGDNAGVPQALKSDGSGRLQTSDTQSGTWNVGLAGAGLGTAGSPSASVLSIQGITSMIALKVDGSGVTQPISGSLTNISGTISLPTGASTSALQSTGNTSLGNIDTSLASATVCATDTGACALNAVAKRIAQNLSTLNTTLGTPASAANQATANTALGAPGDTACASPGSSCSIDAVLKGILTAAQDTSTASAVNQTQVGGVSVSTGNGVAGTGVQRVTIASDNTAFSVNAAITAALNAIADGADVTQGAKADAACGTAAGTCTLQALIKFLNTNVVAATPAGANVIGYTNSALDVATTITRPANTTAYTAGDVVGGALDLGVLGTSGASVEIKGVQLEADIAAIPASQTSWVLYLYNVTPPSALADNAAWDLPSGDRASFLGSIAIPTLVDLGSTLYVEVNGINKRVKLSGTHLFAYLVTVAGWTPAANSEVYKPTLHTVQ